MPTPKYILSRSGALQFCAGGQSIRWSLGNRTGCQQTASGSLPSARESVKTRTIPVADRWPSETTALSRSKIRTTTVSELQLPPTSTAS